MKTLKMNFFYLFILGISISFTNCDTDSTLNDDQNNEQLAPIDFEKKINNKSPENVNENFTKSGQPTESQNEKISDKEVYLNIELHNLTKKDTVSLFINDCVLYKGEGLTYNTTVGQIEIFRLHKRHKCSKSTKINSISEFCVKVVNHNGCGDISYTGINMNLVINQLNNSFPLNLDDGKYIKFDKLDKLDNNKFIFKQSHMPF